MGEPQSRCKNSLYFNHQITSPNMLKEVVIENFKVQIDE